MSTKFCPHCQTEKDVTEFSPSKHNPSGLARYCKHCMVVKTTISRYRRAAYNQSRRTEGPNFTPQEWKQLLKRYNGHCLCCGRREPDVFLVPDHVVPLACGGSNLITNIQPLCMQCNLTKRTQATDYRLTWQVDETESDIEPGLSIKGRLKTEDLADILRETLLRAVESQALRVVGSYEDILPFLNAVRAERDLEPVNIGGLRSTTFDRVLTELDGYRYSARGPFVIKDRS